jgi:hypothetical protein
LMILWLVGLPIPSDIISEYSELPRGTKYKDPVKLKAEIRD